MNERTPGTAFPLAGKVVPSGAEGRMGDVQAAPGRSILHAPYPYPLPARGEGKRETPTVP